MQIGEQSAFNNGAHEDGAGYVQDHAKHSSSILTRRNPTHGGYERNRSPAKTFSSDEQARRDQLGVGDDL